MRLRSALTLTGLALVLAVVGVGWSTDLTISGHDIITADGGGADVFAAGKGEDLLCGGMADHYPWPTAATSISAQVTSASDTGWVVSEGLNSGGDEQADSVHVTGIGTYAIPATWWRVNLARFRDDSTNASTINILAGSAILATIPARQSHSCPDHYTLPAGKRQVIPKSWRVTPVSVAASADSLAMGTAAVVGRERGGNWGILDHLEWSTVTGPVDHPYPPTQWDLGPLADLVVPAAATGASTQVGSRLQFETR